MKVKVKSLSHVRLLATPWTAAYQAPLSMGFPRQEYWSGVPLPSLRQCLGDELRQNPGTWFRGWLSVLASRLRPALGTAASTPVSCFWQGLESHGQRSLVGCSPWGREESDTTERLHFHFSLSCIGEGNGNPLHCSCLENPRDRGAWWAAVYGVAQSRTQLKRLSRSTGTVCCFLFAVLVSSFLKRGQCGAALNMQLVALLCG